MKATLVVPLSGTPGQAWACLEAIAALPQSPEHDVVLVDDGSVGLEAVFDAVAGDVALVRLPRRRGTLAALDAALPHVTGEHTVLVADHAVVGTDLLTRLLAHAPATSGAVAVAAHAVAWPTGTLAAIPDAPERLAVAALVAALAPVTATGAHAAPPDRELHGGDVFATPELSIVIPTLNAAGNRLRACVRALQHATDVSHEIVVVDNGAPPQGFTAPVNSGVRAARGRYVVVCNDDVEVLPGWWVPLKATLDAGAAVAFPLTIDGAMREDFAAWCFALTRATIENFSTTPGELLDPRLVVWYQDTDLLVRLRAAGRPPVLVRESRIRHGLSETVGSADPRLRAWIDGRIAQDRVAFEALHGNDVVGAAR